MIQTPSKRRREIQREEREGDKDWGEVEGKGEGERMRKGRDEDIKEKTKYSIWWKLITENKGKG